MSGLRDRSSRPVRLRQPTLPEQVARVEALRRERWTGVRMTWQTTGLSRATVSRILTRLKLNKMRMLEPAAPIVRYEHQKPGDMLHIDIKKLARIVKAGHRITGDPRDETRGAGWEFLYVAVDDHSRLAYTAMYPNEKAVSSIDFLERATAWFQCFGLQSEGSSPIMGHASTGGSSVAPAQPSTSATVAQDPIDPKPMERQNASSRLLSENGLMLGATKPQPNTSNTCSPGHTSTTGTALMLASTKLHPSAGQDSMTTTC